MPFARRRAWAAKIDFIAPPICARLGVPLPFETGEPCLSAAAIAKPPVYDRARAAARYSETMRDLIQSFKYGDRHEGVPLFGRWLTKAGAELLADAHVIVPVPLFPSRLWWRRFNQSAMLAQEVARLTGVPADCFTLRRVRRTASQVGLTADQRRRNVRGAFKIERARRDRIKGRNVVVVDDVITTDATAEAPSIRPRSCFRLAPGARPDQLSSMARIVLYTTQFCGFCRAAKRLLQDKGLDFEEIDVAFDEALRAEMVQRASGLRTVPQIFIHGRHVGGYQELAALTRGGKLDDWLAAEPLSESART